MPYCPGKDGECQAAPAAPPVRDPLKQRLLAKMRQAGYNPSRSGAARGSAIGDRSAPEDHIEGTRNDAMSIFTRKKTDRFTELLLAGLRLEPKAGGGRT